MLIRLWIAQGFIQSSDERQCLEDVGDWYFMDLLRRSFFQDVEKDHRGNVRVCKMHDLIHDLAQLIAGSESCAIGGDAKYFDRQTRHVFINTDSEDLVNMLERFSEANKLRAFLLVRTIRTFPLLEGLWDQEDVWISSINKIISSFKRIRALDLTRLKIREVPSSISKLGHLKYLDLSGGIFELLPDCICWLHNLQTLILNDCHHLKELPRETKNLVSLRHLEIGRCSSLSHMPHGLGELTSLQTLTQFKVDCRRDRSTVRSTVGLSELEGLVNLRGRLKIGELKGSMAETKKRCPNHSYLVRMEFLEELELDWAHWGYETDTIPGEELLFESLLPPPNLKRMVMTHYGGASFPSWMNVGIGLSLPNLVEISLQDCHTLQHLTPFGHLPSLQVLELAFMDNLLYIYDEEEDCDGTGEYESSTYSSSSSSKAQGLFPSLKSLKLVFLKQLKGLGRRRRKKREEVLATEEELLLTSSFGTMRDFPALQHLDINLCPQLFAAGDDENGMPYLATLQHLRIVDLYDLRTLPGWIGKLRSLQKLEIIYCESLTSLPEWMRSLTTLQELIVEKASPELCLRCQKKTGEDWPKIGHIPHITITRLSEVEYKLNSYLEDISSAHSSHKRH